MHGGTEYQVRKARECGLTDRISSEKWAGAESNCRHEDFQSSALPTELPAHRRRRFISSSARTLLLPFPSIPCKGANGRGENQKRHAAANENDRSMFERGDARLDEIDHLGFELDAVELVDLLHSGRARDVDLGHVVADDVEAHEIQPVALEPRPHHATDLAVG